MSSAATYEAIANAILTVLQGVRGVCASNCYSTNYQVTKAEDFRQAFYDEASQNYNAWTITREGFTDVQRTNIENVLVHPFVIRGIYGYDRMKDTEIAFQNIINLIAEAYRPQGSLGGIVELIQPVQCPTITYIIFGSILCHYCKLTLDVQEFLTA